MNTNHTGLGPFLTQAHLPQSHIMSRHAAVKKNRVRLLYVQPHQVLHHHHHVAQVQLATLRPQGVLSERRQGDPGALPGPFATCSPLR